MSLSGVILGLINIALVVVILMLVGVVIKWGIKWLFSHDTDPMMDKLYVAAVGLIALYMVVAMIFGIPSIHVIGAPPLIR
jgi:hypothetical protein